MFRFVREQGARWLLLLAAIEYLLLTLSLILAMHVRYWDDPSGLASNTSMLTVRALMFAVV
ncbi:MAG: sugar transferase, partial [Dokdonella sp.]